MKPALAVAAALVVAITLTLPGQQTVEADEISEARGVIEELFRAFNNRESDGYYATFHYPQLNIGAAGGHTIAEAPPAGGMDFDAIAKSEGWHHSTLDFTNMVGASPDKVHFDVQFKRYHEDGTAYSRARGIWIIAKKNGKWGVQMRSFLPSERLDDSDGELFKP